MGSVFFRVRHFGGDDAFEVDTPNLAFNVSQPGEFRLDVNENGDQTVATVWHGEGEITGGGDSYRLFAGQQGEFTGTDRLSYNVGQNRDSQMILANGPWRGMNAKTASRAGNMFPMK